MNRSISADSFDWLIHDDLDASETTDLTSDIWREPHSGSLVLIPDYAVGADQSEDEEIDDQESSVSVLILDYSVDEATEISGQESSNLPVADVKDTDTNSQELATFKEYWFGVFSLSLYQNLDN